MARWDPPNVVHRVKLSVHAKNFRPLIPLFFLTEVPFFGFVFFAFLIQKKVWPYKCAYDVPLVTLILNIYEFVDLTSNFQA